MKKTILAACIALAAAMLACAPSRSNAPRSTPVPSTAAAASGGALNEVPAGLQAELEALPEGDAANGERLFSQQPCSVCHVNLQIAPRLDDLSAHASTRKPGYPAEVYLYESIVEPGAYVVEGFEGGIMPENFKETLTPQELADLVAFLLTPQ
jgi:mono/diheme cytochrome c family protein